MPFLLPHPILPLPLNEYHSAGSRLLYIFPIHVSAENIFASFLRIPPLLTLRTPSCVSSMFRAYCVSLVSCA